MVRVTFSIIIFLILLLPPYLNASEKSPGKYATKIAEYKKTWMLLATELNVPEGTDELKIQTINTPEDSTYVGVMAKTTFSAKLSIVLKVLRDIASYKNAYLGLDEVSFENIVPNSFDIHWKFSGPMGTHTVYETTQTVSEITKTKGILTYNLKKSEDVLDANGFIFLQEKDGATKYLSVDFFNAKWGMAGTFFKNKIWETTFENTKKTTLTMKTEAEKTNGKSSGKVSENFVGLDEREKQKTFESLEADIFDAGKGSP